MSNAWAYYGTDESGRAIIVPGYVDPKNKVIFMKIRSCLWDSVLLHEMYHVVREVKNGDADREHKNKERCPPNYKRSNEKEPKPFVP